MATRWRMGQKDQIRPGEKWEGDEQDDPQGGFPTIVTSRCCLHLERPDGVIYLDQAVASVRTVEPVTS